MNVRILIAILLSWSLHGHAQETFCNPKTEPCYAIYQGATSESQTQIHAIVPVLRNFRLNIKQSGTEVQSQIVPYATANYRGLHWKVLKFKIDGLSKNLTYQMDIVEAGRSQILESREFSTLDLQKNQVSFVLASCMSDDWRYRESKQQVWDVSAQKNPDLYFILGDVVYVDSFDFVAREVATEQDMWLRYIDSLNGLPLLKLKKLKPVLFTWDDHDYGTNDGNKYFSGRSAALKVFQAFFGYQDIPGVYANSKLGVASQFLGFGHNFVLLDNRAFREKPRLDANDRPLGANGPYDYLGLQQHNWILNAIAQGKQPTFLFGGNQFFGRRDDFKKKESFEGDYPNHFQKFLKDLKDLKVPVVFGSGDIHFSEVSRIEKEALGYETYEITSSAAHAFVFGNSTEPSWPNARRMAGVKKHNVMWIESKPRTERGRTMQGMDLKVLTLDGLGQNDIHLNLKILPQ